jgi:hypothetical protein
VKAMFSDPTRKVQVGSSRVNTHDGFRMVRQRMPRHSDFDHDLATGVYSQGCSRLIRPFLRMWETVGHERRAKEWLD